MFFVYINPAYDQWPIHYQQLLVPKPDIQLKQACEGLWETVRDRMIRRERNRRPELDMEEQIQGRLDEADRLLPMPPDDDDASGSQKPPQKFDLSEF